MTKTWAMHFGYQVFAFLVAVAMVFGVAVYAFTKSYDARRLSFVEDFTITAHAGAYSTPANTMKSLETMLEKGDAVIEIDVRCRPDGTVVMGHDIITTNNDGVELSSAFEAVKPHKDVRLNLDIKDTRTLTPLHDLIVEYSMLDRVFLTGLDQGQAKYAAEHCPDVAYYINYVPSRIKIFSLDYQQKLITMLEETGAVGINCNYANACRTLSDVLHESGYKLSIWTVDSEYQMKRALVNKPDNITTNHPDKVQELIDNWGKD